MSEEKSIREIRLEKLAKLRELGYDPFGVEKFKIDYSAKHLLDNFDDLADLREETPNEEKPLISFAGRITSLREMGKAAFANISDGEDKIQGYFRKNDLGDEAWAAFQLMDIGDHIGITGFLFLTRTGEKSIHIASITPLSKALHNLPLGKEKDGEQWYGLTDVDQRYRHRHLDLLTNKEARDQLLNRSRIVSEVRRFFDVRGYLEVETPLLQLEAGGAAARPFKTHYNAYDLEVKLRISLELYLKRIICGDVPKVYEIGRVFRNEGVSNRHNPEFTLLEWYEAYANLEDMMDMVETLFKTVSMNVFGKTVFERTRTISIDGLHIAHLRKHIAKYGVLDNGVSYLVERVSEDAVEISVDQFNDTTFALNNDKWAWERLPEMPKFYYDEERTLLFVELNNPEKLNPANVAVYGINPCSGIHLYKHYYNKRQIGGSKICVNFQNSWPRVDIINYLTETTGINISAIIDEYETIKNKLTIEFDNLVKNGIFEIDPAQLLEKLEIPKQNRCEPLISILNKCEIPVPEKYTFGTLIELMVETFLEPFLQEPTFVVGYPIETSPLAKKDPNRPGFTRRFEGYVLGREICNAFSEINDPIDQRERFEQQIGERAKGDDEAHPMDEQFLYALECGMPPTGGCGIGIDRLVMLLTGAEHLREILLFPMMRPEYSHDHPED